MHLYVGIEDIGLTAPQRETLVEALKRLGPKSDVQPARLCHWRLRTDGKAAIFEADFGENEITIAAVKRYLADVFGVDPATVSHTLQQTQYGPLVTFSRGGDRLRLVQFGGAEPTWAESGDACRAYLAANAAAWERAD